MFLADQRLCPVSIGVARTRLTDVAAGGWLSQASAAAYRDGLDHLLWAGPPDDPPGLWRLTRTHFLDPVHQADSTTMGMRWEATGPTGQPFAALDADITLTAEGHQHTQMTLTGVYRPPLDPLSAGLDRALSHQMATATIGSLLTRICGALQATAPAPGDARAPKPRETGPETAT